MEVLEEGGNGVVLHPLELLPHGLGGGHHLVVGEVGAEELEADYLG